jgi:hypothetical protein
MTGSGVLGGVLNSTMAAYPIAVNADIHQPDVDNLG